MKKVAVVGAAIVDILVSPADEGVFLSGSSPAEEIMMSFGGDALNEAAVLHHLGVPVLLETLLGEDEAGEAVARHIEKLGLPAEGVHRRTDMATSVNVVLVKPDGERCFLTNPKGSQRRLSPECIELALGEGIDILSFASIFVFPEMGIAEMAELFRRAKKRGITVCADMTRRKKGETVADMADVLKYVDYLFPNAGEAMLLTGADSPEKAAEALFAAGVSCVVVKCGSAGCFVRSKNGAFLHPAAPAARCVDTTGAGDSFVGGFLSGLARELPLRDCLDIAVQCGARAVEHLGATAWTQAGNS